MWTLSWEHKLIDKPYLRVLLLLNMKSYMIVMLYDNIYLHGVLGCVCLSTHTHTPICDGQGVIPSGAYLLKNGNCHVNIDVWYPYYDYIMNWEQIKQSSFQIIWTMPIHVYHITFHILHNSSIGEIEICMILHSLSCVADSIKLCFQVRTKVKVWPSVT